MIIDVLKKKARQFRKEILETITEAGSGHPGGSLSCVEILISLYYYKMKHKPDNPNWPVRDRFIMSKGHASPVLYVTLADCGYFPKEELKTFRKLGSRLQGHVHISVPGVELSTGSLGQGLSVANGIALGAKIRKVDFNIYCLLGDGEIQEGQVWEAAMTAAHHKLDNVCAILDCNKVQENGPVAEIKNEEPIADKWRDFGWHVIEIDGHNFEELIPALDEFDRVKGKPTFILAHTVKGKGVSFMEGNAKWHGKALKNEELALALRELDEGGR
ncbi:transketolase [bacterium]|nr:transketolase [bacterium]NIN91826.1 transketolase [bacterium]NIO18112.1 transketolase [bacterium]NIO73077.1 transketolase [bacterium]